ncbi:MAG: spondin domain-containing protein, partial [Chloroflexi bacterium]|nr:spondin domain-containing protein [Chloroflexota bacterium]
MNRPSKTVLIVAVFILFSSLLSAGQVAAQEQPSLQVTVRNVTKGQPLTPPVVIVHTGSLLTLPEDPEAIMGLPALAESGDPSAFAAAVADYPGVKSAVILPVDGPIPGGSEATVDSVSAMPGDFVSVISMLACTNDAVAYGTAVISQEGGSFAMSSGAVYDAGTEANDETTATVPCLGGAAAGLSEGVGEGKGGPHPGTEGQAGLTHAQHWRGGPR